MKERLAFLRAFGTTVCAGVAILIAADVVLPQIKMELAERRDQGRLRSHWSSAVATDAAVLFTGKAPGPTIVEFGDYLCEGCKAVHDRLVQSVPENGALRILYRHSPSPERRLSVIASIAAICASEQDAFRRMHDELISFDYHSEPIWISLAKRAGVPDIPRFQNCLDGPQARKKLQHDQAIARNLGVRGTPTFVMSDLIQLGMPPVAWLDSLAQITTVEAASDQESVPPAKPIQGAASTSVSASPKR